MKKTIQIDLAPIQGLTGDLYRTLYQRSFAGVDRYYAPFVKINPHPQGPRKKPRLVFPEYNPALPVVPQILSNAAEEILLLDQALHAAGYPVFNWNLGCPVPMVTRKRRGAGLLPFPDHIVSVLEAVLPRLRCGLSIKTRLGLDRADELLDLIPRLNPLPIQELIIHPRLGRQLYRGQVDLMAFQSCLRLSTLAVTYNGDIFNRATFVARQEQFPRVSRWLLGRGILANPFLPEQITGVAGPAGDPRERLQRFHDAYATTYAHFLSGPAHLLDKLKEFWSYLHCSFSGGRRFYQRLLKIKRWEDYQREVDQFFVHKPELVDHLEMSSEDFW